ncbi:ADP-ribosylation factor-like protein 2 [Galdieria sulphuraria]|nr:ADP-ribosylation factor-like protein 2 [Galdieria sulphuraria]
MGLLTILRKSKRKERELRILLLGLDASGKTTVAKRLLRQDVTDVGPTFGFDIHTVEYQDYKIHIWDIGGQESLRSYWKNYFESTDGIIWVVDIADSTRLSDCIVELHKTLQDERLVGAPLLLLANKLDRNPEIVKEKLVEAFKLETTLCDRPWNIYLCSALYNTGVVQVLRDKASRITIFIDFI